MCGATNTKELFFKAERGIGQGGVIILVFVALAIKNCRVFDKHGL
jgi:hypothetical protein